MVLGRCCVADSRAGGDDAFAVTKGGDRPCFRQTRPRRRFAGKCFARFSLSAVSTPVLGMHGKTDHNVGFTQSVE
jgi:hypothetical protein